MPYILNRAWDSYVPGSGNTKRLYWYMALAPFMTKGYDPLAITHERDLPQVFRACPAWTQWIDPDTASAEWIIGYGQNIHLYAGNYDRRGRVPGGKRVGQILPRKLPNGNDAPGSGFDNISWGIDAGTEAVANARYTGVQAYFVGLPQFNRIPSPSTRVIAGDAVQYWMGLGKRYNVADTVIPSDVKWDLNRANDSADGDATNPNAIQVWAITNWKGGHPNRHGGLFQDCVAQGIGPRVSIPKANYLFADGHVETLSYIDARRIMQTPPPSK
jgi:prepilin-type processing-associated H-X9-DG protein